MTALRKTALFMLATGFLTSAALAAPNSTPDPVATCITSATVQFNIDYATCAGLYPPIATQLLAQCQSQAAVKFSTALS